MIDPALLRSLIRDVIAEEVKALKAGQKGASPASTVEPVRIASDAELAAFAKQVLTLAEAPAVKAAILAGSHPFRLATSGAGQSACGTAHQAGQSHRIDKGVITENAILKLPAGVSRLVLGPEVSVTPLAKDKAKSRNISIERTRR
jgi:hypothetical protein